MTGRDTPGNVTVVKESEENSSAMRRLADRRSMPGANSGVRAVAVGAMIMGMLPWGKLRLYVVAELIGGAAAAMVFRAINPEDR